MSAAYTAQNRIRLIKGGQDYFLLLENLIASARHTLHLQTYIFDEDATGEQIAYCLKQAASRGVQVYLMVDGYASQSLSSKFIKDLEDHQVHFRFFEPVFRSRYFYFGRRLHHKVLVIDSQAALVGGINISDKYNDLPGKPAWHDYALYVEGEVPQQLCVLCWKSWQGFPSVMRAAPCEPKLPVPSIPPEERSLVRMRRNDWVRRKNQISRTYLEILKNAKHEVIIVCSYFLPGRILQKNLLLALRRGITVKVVLAGLSDVAIAKNAERYMYDWMLRNGIQIYEFTDTVLHAKLAIADGEWFTVGSYNVNNISAYASVELNLDVKDIKVTSIVKQQVEELIRDHCIPITRERHNRTTKTIRQFLRWLSYQFFRAVFFIFTFYFKQHN
jgi:cardiolipin synthase